MDCLVLVARFPGFNFPALDYAARMTKATTTKRRKVSRVSLFGQIDCFTSCSLKFAVYTTFRTTAACYMLSRDVSFRGDLITTRFLVAVSAAP